MAARQLSDVYAGVLSRNWPKMLEALESGEGRVLIYSYDLPLDNGKDMVVQGIIECHCFIYDGKTVSYQNIAGCDFFGTMRSEALDRLESRGMGFFPANDSEK